MYKVLIVDDAIWVCELIKKLVDWEALGLEVIGTSYDGINAFEIIKNQNPDIVITDIRMPGLDGLKLIENTIDSRIDVDFIIISGFQDFSYAQKALKFGVKNYILKPINKDELNDAISDVVSGMNKKNQFLIEKNSIAEKLEKKENKLQEEILVKVFSSLYNINSLESFNNEFRFEFKAGFYRVLNFNCITKLEAFENLEKINTWVNKKFKESINEYLYEYRSLIFNENIICVINYKEKERVFTLIEQLFNNLLEKEIVFRSDFVLGVGTEVNNINKINISYQSACDSINSKVLLGSNKIIQIQRQDYHIADIVQIITSEREKQFISYLETLNIEKIDIWIKNIFNIFENDKNICPCLILDFCTEIFRISNKISRRFGIDNIQYSTINKKIRNIASLNEINNILLLFIETTIEQIKDTNFNKNTQAIEKAKKYIMEHFSEDIMLAEVANQVYLNPTYFSELFKKEVGINFSDYLINYRIDKAKEYLKDMRYKIADISFMIGYKNPKYLSQLFKKHVGISPADFRKIFS